MLNRIYDTNGVGDDYKENVLVVFDCAVLVQVSTSYPDRIEELAIDAVREEFAPYDIDILSADIE